MNIIRRSVILRLSITVIGAIPFAFSQPDGKPIGVTTAFAAEAVTGRDVAEDLPLAEAYCRAIHDRIKEARYAHQMRELEKARQEIETRIAKLETQAVELAHWIEQRKAFAERATERLVQIFSSMRPDAASAQLTSLDEMTAAAIVMALEARQAAAILGEMEPNKAARLSAIISGAARVPSQAGTGS